MNIVDFLGYFATFVAFVAGVTTITEFFKKVCNITKKGWMIGTAMIVAVCLSVLGYGLQIGFFAEYGTVNQWQGWIMSILTGAGAGLASCGLYDIDAIEKLVKWIWSFIKPKNKTEVVNE